MSWQEIISQQKVKQILKNSFEQNRIAHSYLFWGSEGIGKDSLAIEFAKSLLCSEKNFESCNKCQSCLKMNSLQHPAFKIICSLPTAKDDNKYFDELQEQIKIKSENRYHKISIQKANFIRIESIREIRSDALQQISNYPRRIFLITNADEMNIEASNAFLKILEEPHPNTIFLLTTSKKELLLPTIISRCQLIKCNNLSESEITNALVQNHKLEFENAKLIAKISGGSFRRAQELLVEDFKDERELIVSFLRSSLILKPLALTNEIENLCANYERNEIERLLSLIQLWLRDSMMLREGVFEEIVNFDQQDSLEKFILKFKNQKIENSISVIDRAFELLKKNVYLPLVLFFTAISLRKIFLYDEQS